MFTRGLMGKFLAVTAIGVVMVSCGKEKKKETKSAAIPDGAYSVIGPLCESTNAAPTFPNAANEGQRGIMKGQMAIWNDVTKTYVIAGDAITKTFARKTNGTVTCVVTSTGTIHSNQTVKEDSKVKSSYFQEDTALAVAWNPTVCTMALENPAGTVAEVNATAAASGDIIKTITDEGEQGLMAVTDNGDNSYTLKIASTLCDSATDSLVYTYTATTEVAPTPDPNLLADISPAAMASASKAYVHAAVPALAGSTGLMLSAGAESVWNTASCVKYSSYQTPTSIPDFLQKQTDDTLKGSGFGDFTLMMDQFCMIIYFIPAKDEMGVPVDGTYTDVKVSYTEAMRTACNLSTVTKNDIESEVKDGGEMMTETITVSTPKDTTLYSKKIAFASGLVVYYRYDQFGNINIASLETNNTDHNLDMVNRTFMSYDAATQVTRFERARQNFYTGNLWKSNVRIFHEETTKRTDILMANQIGDFEMNMSIAGTDSQYAVSLATIDGATDTTPVDTVCRSLNKANACVDANSVVTGSGTSGASITCNKVSPTVMTNDPLFIWTTHTTSASYTVSDAIGIAFTTAANMYTKATP